MKFSYTVSAAVVGAVTAFAAYAQGIPEGVATKELRGLEGPSAGLHISNNTIGATPLGSEGIAGFEDRDLRARYWKILSGGIVPVHEHANRPATIFILQGEIFEYRNDEDDPLAHMAGELSLEEGSNLSHWWINRGNEGVRLIAFDAVLRGNNADPVELAQVPASPSGFDLPDVSDATKTTVGFVDLEKHFEGEIGQGLALTHSMVTIEPGGTFALWTSPGQPAVIFVESGAVTETRSDTDQSTVIPPENGSIVANGAQAYWSNPAQVPAVLHIGAVEPIEVTEGVVNPSHSD